MGITATKPKAPDMNTVVFRLKLAAKRFARESARALKDRERNLKSAKACLRRGDETGARLYASNAQSNEDESRKYIAMGTRLDAISGQLKSSSAFQEVMRHVSRDVAPLLEREADALDVREMVAGLEGLQDAFDRVQVNSGVMGKRVEGMREARAVENTENLLAQLKNEIGYEMARETEQTPIAAIEAKRKTADEENLDNFINGLRK